MLTFSPLMWVMTSPTSIPAFSAPEPEITSRTVTPFEMPWSLDALFVVIETPNAALRPMTVPSPPLPDFTLLTMSIASLMGIA